MSKKGRRYEHDLAASIDEQTTDEVWVTTAGYSGNSRIDATDLVITRGSEKTKLIEQYNVEAKKTNGTAGNRSTVFAGSSSGESGVEELKRMVESCPSWATPVVVIRFDHRKPITVLASVLLDAASDEDTEAHFGVRTTPAGAISMRKPELDEWASASGIADGRVVARELVLPLRDNLKAEEPA